MRTVTASSTMVSARSKYFGGIEMIERRALRIAQVVEHGAAGRDGRGFSGEPATIERKQMEVLAQDAVGVIDAEDPVIELGDDPAFRFGLRE